MVLINYFLNEILQIKSELANAQSKYKKSSNIVINLEEKLNQLEPILLENQKAAVEAAIVVNNSQLKSYENQITELKKKSLILFQVKSQNIQLSFKT